MATFCAENSGLTDMADRSPTFARITDALAGARRVADIGCGAGGLSGALVKCGFDVVGIDPQAPLIAVARKRVPAAEFVVAEAEAMPLAAASFDGAVILNALHHVPHAAMDGALRGALRLLRPDGVLVVVEPLAEGSFFHAMQPVDDETVVRARALDALSRLIDRAPDSLVQSERYEIPMHFDDSEAFLTGLLEADPARADRIPAQREAVLRAIRDHATPEATGFTLTASMAIWVFRVPEPTPGKAVEARC
jgi:SAM-dependent methyltransferase